MRRFVYGDQRGEPGSQRRANVPKENVHEGLSATQCPTPRATGHPPPSHDTSTDSEVELMMVPGPLTGGVGTFMGRVSSGPSTVSSSRGTWLSSADPP